MLNKTIEHFTFRGGADGPTLVLVGGVHGDEKCGAIALNRLKQKLGNGTITLQSGKLIMIPVANPEAFAADKRFLERNLNRSLYPKAPDKIKVYEDHLDNQICAVLDQADYLLDIHSYHAGGPPFVFISGHNQAEKDFAMALGVTTNFVWDWENAFQASGIPEEESWGTTGYLRSKGIPGVTLECGQHKDPLAPDVAYAGILHAMMYLRILDEKTALTELQALPALPETGDFKFARMHSVILNEPARLSRPFKHFESVAAGETIALRQNSESITAPKDGFVILPHPEAEKGTELCYFATSEEPLPRKSAVRV